MKIGIYNIYTSLVLLIFILGGAGIFYYSITDHYFATFEIIDVFIVIIALIALFTLVITCYRFRILMINEVGIVCFYPFLLKKRELKWNEIKKQDFEVYYDYMSKSLARKVVLSNDTVKISFSDVEFENFQSLILHIPQGGTLLKKINLAYKQDIQDIEIATPIIFGVLSLFILYCAVTCSMPFFIPIALLLLYASFRRIKEYISIHKMQG